MDLAHLQNVLIVKPSSLGDVVHALPAVHALKQAHPHLKLSWLVNPEWAPLLEGNPDLERVLLFPRGEFRGLRGIPRLARWVAQLNWERPDLALDFQGLFRSALLCRLAKAPHIHCLSNAEPPVRFLAHLVVRMEPHEHAVDRYLRLVSDLGVTVERPVQFPLPAGNRPSGFSMESGFVLLHPFSRGQNKSLTAKMVEELSAKLAPHTVVLAGRAPEQVSPLPNLINLLNRTSLSELIWLCRRAAFICSVDSGPMHIAAAITDRLLGIHTWTDPRKVGPYPGSAWIWKAGKILRRHDLAAADAQRNVPFTEAAIPALAEHIHLQASAAALS